MTTVQLDLPVLHNEVAPTMQPFPNFTPVNDVEEEYKQYIAQYPAYSDYSFGTLNIWWSFGQNARVAKLGDNVVLELFGDGEEPTYCFVGTDNVRQNIAILLEQLHAEHKQPKLEHVPEFIVQHLDREEFGVAEELDYNEYLLSAEDLAHLEGSSHSRTRRKVVRFIREAGESVVSTTQIDLDDEMQTKHILDFCEERVRLSPRGNDLKGDEVDALRVSIGDARKLGVKGLAVHVDARLHAVVLYQVAHDGSSFIINHIKCLDEIPHTFDYATNAVAKLAHESGAEYLNFEMDLGIEGLRQHKMGLRPLDFLRKYTISPKN